jgi:sucrose phosphorylase
LKNGVVLITYADSLGGNLKALRSNLIKFFPGCISGVHLLPFFPSSGDRGFSPVRYDQIDPSLGTREDLAELGSNYELIADFMVNHISRRSVYFQDWLKNEDSSPYRDLFLPLEKIFGKEKPTEEEISAIYRRQPTEPWLTVKFPSGSEKQVWCTFSEEQIDIDIASPAGLKLFEDTLRQLKDGGISMMRLDAVGYITKRKGTSCFMVEPDIWEILSKLNLIASKFGIELLPEMHEHYSIQLKLASKGFQVYDFALPLLLLYARYASNFEPLKHWLKICPQKQFTTLDTHDGIGVVDAADLMSPEQIDFTVAELYSRGSNINRKYSSSEYHNLDIYQINCTYYSALGEDDDAYITARAIQFFTPGTPQVNYVGMLAGSNDLDLVEKTRNGRDINRHNYTPEEINLESKRPVVQRLKKLMEFRMSCEAFDGTFYISDSNKEKLELQWTNNGETAYLAVDLLNKSTLITHIRADVEINSFQP